jgi:hypothetical protein
MSHSCYGSVLNHRKGIRRCPIQCEELVYEEKIDRITVQLEELILDALMAALEKNRERNELFRRFQTKSAENSSDF